MAYPFVIDSFEDENIALVLDQARAQDLKECTLEMRNLQAQRDGVCATFTHIGDDYLLTDYSEWKKGQRDGVSARMLDDILVIETYSKNKLQGPAASYSPDTMTRHVNVDGAPQGILIEEKRGKRPFLMGYHEGNPTAKTKVLADLELGVTELFQQTLRVFGVHNFSKEELLPYNLDRMHKRDIRIGASLKKSKID